MELEIDLFVWSPPKLKIQNVLHFKLFKVISNGVKMEKSIKVPNARIQVRFQSPYRAHCVMYRLISEQTEKQNYEIPRLTCVTERDLPLQSLQ